MLTREAIMAMEAGPEMDRAVGELVMGWVLVWYEREDCKAWTYILPKASPEDHDIRCYIGAEPRVGGLRHWSPSTDIAAAWEVVEKMRAAKWFFHCDLDDGPDLVMFYRTVGDYGKEPDSAAVEAKSMPLAICRAALLTTLPT